MKNYLLFILLLLAGSVAAQNKAYEARAEKAFAEKDYATAAYYYDKALESGTVTSQGKVPYFSKRAGVDSTAVFSIRFKLAEAYRLQQNYALAEPLYKGIIEADESNYPLARLWYGVCLRCSNHVDPAISQLQLFISSNKSNKNYGILGNNEMQNSQFAKAQMDKASSTKVEKLQQGFSSEENDFGISVTERKAFFTATSANSETKNRNQLFLSNVDSLTKRTALSLFPDNDQTAHIGSHTMDSLGNKMYLTSWYKKDGETISAIYLSIFTAGRWGSLQKLNSFVNAEGYLAMQPFVTPDGKRLYYVSNRLGGLGGNDIWMCDLDQDGRPLNATNLGEGINTAADEASPYYHTATRRLIFSSKGYVGMGNFDLYESSAKPDSGWTAPHNLGFPINSTKDDLYYYIDDKEEGTAYLSSDRESECCLNLFKVRFAKPEPQWTVYKGRAVDCDKGDPLSGVKVELTDGESHTSLSFETGESGKYEFSLKIKRTYQLRFEKEGYFSKVLNLAALPSIKADTMDGGDICLKMFEVDKPIVIENVLYDFNKAILKPESLIVLEDLVSLMKDNPKIKFELSSHTDSIGPEWYNIRLSQQRAQACVDYIVSRGVSNVRILAKGYGESRPVEPNSLPNGKDNKEGRRMNRRTEFKVLSLE